ncbi:MAG: hypothetical protein OMM_05748 [Candidatus Magnetoglobus multicellularis str. Araruama]|uniref:DNA translocase FtsK 4TM region domain-containing protein n=1 Tax=Candidatus Magnetoglobus multicellularis str. Araruama TaxID=890399 RepID=A0A1V1NUJ0_9BACT|nr:MAG: hypothetical protein OMM_05748 [Candidatus Magnetoglobus multicellularis str. Araruama]
MDKEFFSCLSFFLYLGFLILSGYAYLHFNMRLIGGVLGILSTVTLIELQTSGALTDFAWSASIYDGGGFVGHLISYVLQWGVGLKGTYILIIAGLCIAFILTFNLKISEIFIFIGKIFLFLGRFLVGLFLPKNKEKSKRQKDLRRKNIVSQEVGQDDLKEHLKKTLFDDPHHKQQTDLNELVVSQTNNMTQNYELPPITLLNDYQLSSFKKKK